METIRNYLESMFKNLPQTDAVVKAKYELSQMMEDKYAELIKEGKSESEAIGTVITEFGNLEDIAKDLGIDDISKGTGTASATDGVYADYRKTSEYSNKRSRRDDKPKYINKASRIIMEVFWSTITCVYLAWSFISFDWHITWIIWPIAGVVHTILKNCLTKDESEE